MSVVAGAEPRAGGSLRHAAEFTAMAELMKKRIAGRRVAFFTNPGNLGDALIESGAVAFLNAHGIPFSLQDSRKLHELHATHFKLAYAKHQSLSLLSGGRYRKYTLSLRDIARENDVAVICGSGSFVSQWPLAKQIVELCAGWFSDLIVLPSTYALAPETDRDILYFARDRFESLDVIPSATFCHDLALFLAPEDVKPVRKVGYHVRTDCESAGTFNRPMTNDDISASGTEHDPAERMFEAVGRSETVVTDRLHVCIAAALLGRRVYLFRGNYFKIEAIYKSSLKPYYPNVTLLDRWEQLPGSLRP